MANQQVELPSAVITVSSYPTFYDTNMSTLSDYSQGLMEALQTFSDPELQHALEQLKGIDLEDREIAFMLTEEDKDQLLNLLSRNFHSYYPQDREIAKQVLFNLFSSTVLIAGAGSVGSNFAKALIQYGGGNVIITDPDKVSKTNAFGQAYTQYDVEKNKSHALSDLLMSINPMLTKARKPMVYEEGVTLENIEELVAKSEIIFDGIDIGALPLSYALHVEAKRQKKPVIVSFDTGRNPIVMVFRYDLNEELNPYNDVLNPLFSFIEEFQDKAMSNPESFTEAVNSLARQCLLKLLPYGYLPISYMTMCIVNSKSPNPYNNSVENSALAAITQGAMAADEVVSLILEKVTSKKSDKINDKGILIKPGYNTDDIRYDQNSNMYDELYKELLTIDQLNIQAISKNYQLVSQVPAYAEA